MSLNFCIVADSESPRRFLAEELIRSSHRKLLPIGRIRRYWGLDGTRNRSIQSEGVWYLLAVRNAKKEIQLKMGMSWRTIIAALGTAAELVRSTKNLRETINDLGDKREDSSPPPAEQDTQSASTFAELRARMERIEASEANKAELIAKMADQDQVLWNQLQQLAARVDKIFWIAFVALIFSSVLILYELTRLFL